MREDEAIYPFWLEETGEPGRWRLGLSEVYLETLTHPLVGLELTAPPTCVNHGDTFGFLHTDSGSLDLRAPFRMEILETNHAALADARLVRLSPYGRGWLALVRVFEANRPEPV